MTSWMTSRSLWHVSNLPNVKVLPLCLMSPGMMSVHCKTFGRNSPRPSAVANESGLNFISVKGPELLNMYVGESERAVHQVFQRGQNAAPCVIFFDEIDALCPRRSADELLTEMDGLETRRQVFIMAATNRPDIINPAFLRPGRFNKKLYVDFPSPEDRHAILLTITKGATKPRLDPDVSSEEIARDELCDCFTTGSCRRNCVNLSLGSRRVDGEFSIFKINIFWTSGA
ncbi:nuclear valosin-containing protein-like isoform X2 [Tachysurus fulvidraco]|uniref:nuclear valosin-containing protein-like isoform X2 n=1 Tax=Tachysurus fulvidraco TaxID=1234273 RepID=UPI001FF06D4E|nr:nuclear valosin-containing protein-like isoform X2 [Tachysurus fulvidraco]